MLELIERIRALAAERAEIQTDLRSIRAEMEPRERHAERTVVELLARSAERARSIEAAFAELAKHSRAQADALRLEIIANQASKGAK